MRFGHGGPPPPPPPRSWSKRSPYRDASSVVLIIIVPAVCWSGFGFVLGYGLAALGVLP